MVKIVIRFLIFALVVISFLSFSAFASETPATITFGDVSGTVGEVVDVPVTFDCSVQLNTIAIVDFDYNTEVLEFVDFVAEEQLSDSAFIYELDKEKEAVTIGFMHHTTLSDEVIFNIRFKVVSAGTSKITADRVVVKRSSVNIEYTVLPGIFSISQPVQSVSLDKKEATVNCGNMLALIATVSPSNATNKSLIWSTSNPDVASVENGVVTALGSGSADITVKTVDGGYTDICRITVVVPVTGVSLNVEELTIGVNESEFLSATVIPHNATNQNVVWSTSDDSVAVVDRSGRVTGVAPGKAEITVTTDDGSFTDVVTVHVVIPVIGVELDCDETTIGIGEEKGLAANVLPENATNKDVIWNSSNPEVATVEAGVVTGLKTGHTVITVITKEGGFKDTCVVNVFQPVSCVKLNETAVELNVGESTTLVASVLPENASNKAVSWSSSDSSVASVDDGVVFAKNAGKAVITVKTLDGGFEAQADVTVKIPVTGLALDKETIVLKAGESNVIKASLLPEDATEKAVLWTSSDESVAMVNNGTVTAVNKGVEYVTAKTLDGGFTKSCQVVVTTDASNETDGTFIFSDALCKRGNEFVVDVTFECQKKINSLAVAYFEYNEEVLEFVEFIEDESVRENAFIYELDAEKLAVTIGYKTPVIVSGKLFSMKFKVKDDALNGYEPINADLHLIKNSGKVYSSKIVPSIVTVREYILGDIDSNLSVDIDDAILLFQHSMIPELYPVTYPGSMDFDKNDSVDIDDAILVFQHSMLPHLYPLS